jgi:hypothetical protein
MPPLHHRQMVDDALDAYLEWRQQCSAVWDAYARWANATPEDKLSAYAAYQAALDREEAAAIVYRTLVDRVSDLLAQTARSAAAIE